eukprot:tig00001623_g9419.t1
MCHVFERESFEDEQVAQRMNALFVNIKLDREERPDIDRVYMSFVQATTGGGGWPMSVWLTPELKPFVGATYFPKKRFLAVMDRVAEMWRTQREEVLEQGEQMLAALRAEAGAGAGGGGGGVSGAELEGALEKTFAHFERIYDEERGGFGGAPKFPRPVLFPFLLRCAARDGPASPRGRRALAMLLATLRAMAAGGMRDQLAGGFHRYSVDEFWHVPHFEKMSYDQSQLAAVYLDAFLVSRDPQLAHVVASTLEYVARDMRSPLGGFYSAEDADSAVSHEPGAERREGAFYVWGAGEVREALRGALPSEAEAAAAFDAFARAYNVTERGNVRAGSDPHGEFIGKNVLGRVASDEQVAEAMGGGRTAPEVARLLEASRRALLEARARRPRPALDDKVVCAWTGLLVGAFARAGAALDRPDFIARAEEAAGFVRERMTAGGDERRLLRAFRGEGASPVAAFAEDYACLASGLLDLYEATLEPRWLLWARALQAEMDARFWDAEGGGYFADSGSDPSVLLRLKDDYEGAEPTANAVAAQNLLRMARLFPGRGDYGERAGRTLGAFREQLLSSGPSLPSSLAALASLERMREGASPLHVVIVGDPKDARTRRLAHAVLKEHVPDRTMLCLDGGPGQDALLASAGEMEETYRGLTRRADGAPYAQVCERNSCQLPVTDPAALEALLRPRSLRLPD